MAPVQRGGPAARNRPNGTGCLSRPCANPAGGRAALGRQ